MFIYACAHSLAKCKKTSYSLSSLKELRYFELFPAHDRWNSLKWMWFRMKNLLNKFRFEHLQDNREDYSTEMLIEGSKDIWYYGYFQGENYFYKNDNDIRSRFRIKKKYRRIFDEINKEKTGGQEYAIVHIRLKDYKTFGPDYLNGPDLTLPYAYYHNLIKNEIPSGQLIVFLSDDIDAIKEEFSYVENAYFSENPPIVDLQFIMSATTCILSCSTFSWWGAWLNQNEKKIIYVPEYFLGFKVNKEYPINIIPKAWNKVRATV